MGKIKVQLSEADRLYLKSYVSKGNHSARAIRRARMLLLMEEGIKNQKQIAHDCNCSEGTVTNVVKRFQECRGASKRSVGGKATQWSAHHHYPRVGSKHYRACLLQ